MPLPPAVNTEEWPGLPLGKRGYTYAGMPIKDRAWRRYRLVCAGMTVKGFNWELGA